MSYVPKYILKRIVPKVANIDLSGDSIADHVGVKYVNVLAPLDLSEDFDIEEIKKQFKYMNIDEEKITDLEQMSIWYEGEIITMKDIDKLVGKVLPIGSFIIMLLEKAGGISAGKHKFGMCTEFEGKTEHTEVEKEISDEVKSLDFLTA